MKGWYKIRDLLLGRNFKKQNIPKALELAKKSDHPEAIWVVNVFKGINEPLDIFFIDDIFLIDDIKARWYISLIFGCEDVNFTVEMAKKGDSFAQALCSDYIPKLLDRDAYATLGYYLQAAKLGCVSSMHEIGNRSTTINERYKWWCKAIKNGYPIEAYFHHHVPDYGLSNDTKFKIGEISGEISGQFEYYAQFYRLQLSATREAVDTFSLIGRRLNICKDVRILIGRYIWKTRKEGNYLIKEN